MIGPATCVHATWKATQRRCPFDFRAQPATSRVERPIDMDIGLDQLGGVALQQVDLDMCQLMRRSVDHVRRTIPFWSPFKE